MQWRDKWKDYEVVCNRKAPNELSCEFRKKDERSGVVIPGRLEIAIGNDGVPQLTKFEGNPSVINDGLDYVKGKIKIQTG